MLYPAFLIYQCCTILTTILIIHRVRIRASLSHVQFSNKSNTPQQSPRCAHFTLLVNLFTVFAAFISQAKDNISKFVNGDNRLNTKT